LAAESDVGQAEPLRITLGPLEIIHQAPGVVTANVRAIFDGSPRGANITAVEIAAPLVRNLSVIVRWVPTAAAVFCNLDLLVRVSREYDKPVISTKTAALTSEDMDFSWNG
jgi:hypothetical protein